MSKIISLADMLFCRQCIACGETIPLFSEEEFCSDCIKNVTRLKKDELVLAHVMKAKSVFAYDGALRKALVRFKYNNNAQAGRFLANEIAALIKKDRELTSVDYVINVPNGKYATERLYNQSMFLAKIVARKCKLKFLPNALKKKQGVKSQLKCKTRLERKENIKAAFYA